MRQRVNREWLNIVICFALALLLAMSLSLSFTGAWFTDIDSATTPTVSLKFGTVKIGENPVVSAVSNIVPTQKITYQNASNSNIQYSGDVSAYYKISFSISELKNADTNATVSSPTLAQLKSMFTFDATNKANDNNLYGKVVANGTIPKGNITFSQNADNTYKNLSFKITLTIFVLQSDNISIGTSGTEAQKIKVAFDNFYSI